MKNAIESANDAITAIFNTIADNAGAITGEQYTAYTVARDSVLARHGITLQDYLTWCDDQEAAN